MRKQKVVGSSKSPTIFHFDLIMSLCELKSSYQTTTRVSGAW